MITVWVQKDNLDNYQVIPEPPQKEKKNFYKVTFNGEFEDLAHIKFELLENGICSYRYDDTFNKANILKEKQTLMVMANDACIPLQDAVDLDIATDQEIALLNAWKKYRVLLNRVDLEANPVVWPEQPAAVS